jgi:hypothetical protein
LARADPSNLVMTIRRQSDRLAAGCGQTRGLRGSGVPAWLPVDQDAPPYRQISQMLRICLAIAAETARGRGLTGRVSIGTPIRHVAQ